MTDKIYFSRVGDCDKWITDKDTGILNIYVFPKKWWSIKNWKICIDFQKNFRSGFITKDIK